MLHYVVRFCFFVCVCVSFVCLSFSLFGHGNCTIYPNKYAFSYYDEWMVVMFVADIRRHLLTIVKK